MLEIDLKKHGIIEAHAGTGKTWTIVNNIVLPALYGKNGELLHIRDFLLVTYTEKAAGELKERIRKEIEERLKNEKHPKLQAHLEDCLNTFHEAYIGTIHSICLRLLQNYPFECGLQVSTEVVDDFVGLKSLSTELFRSLWVKLGISEDILSKIKIDPQYLKERIIETASYLINSEVFLYNLPQRRNLKEVLHDFEKREEVYLKIFSIVKNNKETIKKFLEKNPSLPFELVKKLEELYTRWTNVIEGKINEISKDIKCGGKSSKYLENIFRKNINQLNDPLISSLCDTYENLFTLVSTEEFKRFTTLEDEFILYTILQISPFLCKMWQEKKRKEGLLSFSDMLFFIHKAVHNNENFRKLLRKKFKIAVIDEFQDTGVLQWEIFKKIFIDEIEDKNYPRLFIVGDPKQSIYSFQNAVVESYLDACEIINKCGKSQKYTLTENYRTIEKLIEAYNILFTYDSNFFCSNNIKYEKENVAYVPSCHREIKVSTDDSLNFFFEKPLQIVPLYGRKYQRIFQYSLFIVETIKKLYGSTVKIPEGNSVKSITLDYNHFAILCENHNIADMILNILLENNIPATKYKHEGIFSSKMAIQLRVLLHTIKNIGSDSSQKIKTLLTDFFGYRPEEITPETVPIIEENIGSLLNKWHMLAKNQKWPLLFKSIVDESNIKERLITTPNGERYLSDLRQIIDYSLEMLLKKKYTLDELIEHLFALSEGYEIAEGDVNIYAKESDKNKVQVMTIHASKGLEFPICFVATATSSSLRYKTQRWVDKIEETEGDERRCIYIMPSEVNNISLYKEIVEEKKAIIKAQEEREKRRLLYVAITRAKLLLFIPMHLDSPKEEGQKWETCKPSYGGENILTPLLIKIADLVEGRVKPYVEYIGICKTSFYSRTKTDSTKPIQKNISSQSIENKLGQIENDIINAIKKIDIPSRRNILTSYTAIVHKDRIENIEAQSDEQYIENISEVNELKKNEFILPSGTQMGIAFHKIIEYILSLEKWNEILLDFQNNWELIENIKLILDSNGIFRDIAELQKNLIIEKVLKITTAALFYSYELPEYGKFSISNINCKDFKTEVEFNIAEGKERLIGYIDLLFRVKSDSDQYRYFIVDWKSNYLEDYSPKAIEEDIKKSLYDIQAKIYCYGLHRWLSLILGKRYNPKIHLGGALYVYLRGFENTINSQPWWFYKADPQQDEIFFKSEIKNFIKKSTYV